MHDKFRKSQLNNRGIYVPIQTNMSAQTIISPWWLPWTDLGVTGNLDANKMNFSSWFISRTRDICFPFYRCFYPSLKHLAVTGTKSLSVAVHLTTLYQSNIYHCGQWRIWGQTLYNRNKKGTAVHCLWLLLEFERGHRLTHIRAWIGTGNFTNTKQKL
jgi:hypothetical protein